MRNGVFQIIAAKALLITMFSVVSPAFAQEEDEGWRVAREAEAPRSAQSADVIARAKDNAISTEIIYAEEIEGSLGEARRAEPEQSETAEYDFRPDFNANIYIVILLMIGAIFLWIKFGGSAALTAAAPKSTKSAKTAPSNWKIDKPLDELDRDDFFTRLSKAEDCRAGLVELLRYALMEAGEKCDIVFARSDTEREAYARIPSSWRHKTPLGELLKKTELVHYGGREIDQTSYFEAINTGKAILSGSKVIS